MTSPVTFCPVGLSAVITCCSRSGMGPAGGGGVAAQHSTAGFTHWCFLSVRPAWQHEDGNIRTLHNTGSERAIQNHTEAADMPCWVLVAEQEASPALSSGRNLYSSWYRCICLLSLLSSYVTVIDRRQIMRSRHAVDEHRNCGPSLPCALVCPRILTPWRTRWDFGLLLCHRTELLPPCMW
jgi:hypothetical protein